MEQKSYTKLTDEELLIEKQKLKKDKLFHAVAIGFLAGVFLFGIVSWLLSENRRIGFFIPMLIPVLFIYRMLKNGKKNKELETVLRERNLD